MNRAAVVVLVCVALAVSIGGCSEPRTERNGATVTSGVPTDEDVSAAEEIARTWLESSDGDVRYELTTEELRSTPGATLTAEGYYAEVPPGPDYWDQPSPPVVSEIRENSRGAEPGQQQVAFDVLLASETESLEIYLNRFGSEDSWRVSGVSRWP